MGAGRNGHGKHFVKGDVASVAREGLWAEARL